MVVPGDEELLLPQAEPRATRLAANHPVPPGVANYWQPESTTGRTMDLVRETDPSNPLAAPPGHITILCCACPTALAAVPVKVISNNRDEMCVTPDLRALVGYGMTASAGTAAAARSLGH